MALRECSFEQLRWKSMMNCLCEKAQASLAGILASACYSKLNQVLDTLEYNFIATHHFLTPCKSLKRARTKPYGRHELKYRIRRSVQVYIYTTSTHLHILVVPYHPVQRSDHPPLSGRLPSWVKGHAACMWCLMTHTVILMSKITKMIECKCSSVRLGQMLPLADDLWKQI